MDPEALGVEDRHRLEFRREGFRGERVSRLMTLGVRALHGRARLEDGFRRPPDRRRLGAPDRLRLVLGFGQPPGGARLVQELLFPVQAELVPVHGVVFGVAFRVADHLTVAFGEGRDRAFGNIEGDDGLALGVEADPNAERP